MFKCLSCVTYVTYTRRTATCMHARIILSVKPRLLMHTGKGVGLFFIKIPDNGAFPRDRAIFCGQSRGMWDSWQVCMTVVLQLDLEQV